jgi:hypothetical protein
MSKINLILANDMKQGREVMDAIKTRIEDSAVITQPGYFSYITFLPGETVYAHADTNSALLNAFYTKREAEPLTPPIKFEIIKK